VTGNADAIATYARWHRAQVETNDLDPAYPVLRFVADGWHLDAEQRAWLAVCHVTLYHLASTLAMFERYPSPADLPEDGEALIGLPTATERRGLRDPRARVRHLRALRRAMVGGAREWLGGDGWQWDVLNDRITRIHGNGRWASYKLAELLQKVADVPTQALDAGHAHSSGPRKGLGLLWSHLPADNGPAAIALLDWATADLGRRIGEPDVAQVETSLCDWYSLNRGHYYLGHDIDAMLAQLRSPYAPRLGYELAMDARSAVFAGERLGELGGWEGPRRHAKQLYLATGTFDPCCTSRASELPAR
jgi:hypothetical protein